MSQAWLNHAYIYKELPDKLDLIAIANEFGRDSEQCLMFFGKFV